MKCKGSNPFRTDQEAWWCPLYRKRQYMIDQIPFFPKLVIYGPMVSGLIFFIISFSTNQYQSMVESLGESTAKKACLLFRYGGPLMVLFGLIQLLWNFSGRGGRRNFWSGCQHRSWRLRYKQTYWWIERTQAASLTVWDFSRYGRPLHHSAYRIHHCIFAFSCCRSHFRFSLPLFVAVWRNKIFSSYNIAKKRNCKGDGGRKKEDGRRRTEDG